MEKPGKPDSAGIYGQKVFRRRRWKVQSKMWTTQVIHPAGGKLMLIVEKTVENVENVKTRRSGAVLRHQVRIFFMMSSTISLRCRSLVMFFSIVLME